MGFKLEVPVPQKKETKSGKYKEPITDAKIVVGKELKTETDCLIVAVPMDHLQSAKHLNATKSSLYAMVRPDAVLIPDASGDTLSLRVGGPQRGNSPGGFAVRLSRS